MNRSTSQALDKLTNEPKNIFLIDAIGALTTALLLFILPAISENFFNLPKTVLYFFAMIACGYGIYSLSCYKFIKQNTKSFLLLLIVANCLYCVATIVTLLQFRGTLAVTGLIYFLLETGIIGILVWVELKTLSKLRTANS